MKPHPLSSRFALVVFALSLSGPALAQGGAAPRCPSWVAHVLRTEAGMPTSVKAVSPEACVFTWSASKEKKKKAYDDMIKELKAAEKAGKKFNIASMMSKARSKNVVAIFGHAQAANVAEAKKQYASITGFSDGLMEHAGKKTSEQPDGQPAAKVIREGMKYKPVEGLGSQAARAPSTGWFVVRDQQHVIQLQVSLVEGGDKEIDVARELVRKLVAPQP